MKKTRDEKSHDTVPLMVYPMLSILWAILLIENISHVFLHAHAHGAGKT
jgi:hypothetical protein